MQEWVGGLVEFRPLSPGPELGSRAIQVVELAGKKLELESEITRYEPPYLLEASLVAPKDFESVARYRLDEADGHTRVTTTMETQYKHRVVRLLSGVVTRQAQRKLEADLDRLKQVLESSD
jgi:Polyketide cyclase / dehydrase and lipid transport